MKVAGVSGGLSIALGAFGAHGLKSRVDASMIKVKDNHASSYRVQRAYQRVDVLWIWFLLLLSSLLIIIIFYH